MVRTDGLLENGAALAGITASQLEQFRCAAVDVSKQVVDEHHRTYLIPCNPKADDAADSACAGGRLLRRLTLSSDELGMYVDRGGSAADALEGIEAHTGTGEGLTAGYVDVDAFTNPTHHQRSGQFLSPSEYRAMHRFAGGYPDAKTGKNTAISSAVTVKSTQVYLDNRRRQW